ncbi:GNAT family N-acetyltransferase [Flagellimonas algicola]|uniref:GNAT family N-acetyltransferase n=1 Tax=Flagellimonas algicola TaxID=2583815 RepID=A0ABY2WQG0_9FLAO|nr:GNAT family N-acetyltransferase [Allomuricauda algicola]TMU57243.1 GNAT family N-acetyltransferase [Allomuricauda algicola]
MQIDILKKEDLTPEIQLRVNQLFKQLAPHLKPLNLKQVLRDGNQVTIALCKEEDEILGMASLCEYQAISGKKGWIEDVVVDENARGKGIGRKLMEKLLEISKEKELAELLLFTGHHRLPAMALYESLGFKLRKSGLYFIKNP